MFHINGNHVVDDCGAQEKENCPFFGNFGTDNHYENKADAQRAADLLGYRKYNPLKSARAKSKEQRETERIKAIWSRYGKSFAPSNPLENVNSTAEMVEKWFGGEKGNLEAFQHLMTNDSITEKSKQSIGSFAASGFALESAQSVHDISTTGKNLDYNHSSVTFLDETDEPEKIAREELIEHGLTTSAS